MQPERGKFLEELQCRLKEKTPEEQEAERALVEFVQETEKFANELEADKKFVNVTNLYDMFVERKYSGIYDIFKLDQDEGMIRLAIGIVIREREKYTINER